MPKYDDFLHSIFDAITDGITVLDDECSIRYINNSLTHYYGYEDPRDLVGKKCYSIFRGKKKRCSECPAMVVFDTQKPEHKYTTGSDSHGNEIFWELYFYPIYDDNGKVSHVVEYTRNITREKVLEKQFEETERKLSELLSVNRDVIVEYNDKLELRYVSENVKDFLGYSARELIENKNYLELVTPRSREKLLKNFKSRMQGKSIPGLIEYELIHKNGSIIPIETTVSVQKEKGKVIGGVATLRNIKERKEAQDARRESEKRYKGLFEKSPDSIVLVDAKGIITDVNRTTEKLIGYSKKDIVGKQFADLPAVNSKDLPKIQKRFKRIMDGKSIKPYELEITRKDGTKRWVSIVSSLVKKDDAITGIHVTSRDITERKLAQEKLKESEKLYRTLVETSPDGIVLTDLDTNIIMVNQSGVKTLGYKKPEEIIGMSAFDLMAPEDQKRIFESVAEIVDTGRIHNVEFNFLHKNGSRVPIEFNASLVNDENGEPYAFMGISRDIRERKKAEQEIAESREKYINLFQKSNDAIIIHDSKGKILDVNQKTTRLFGYSKSTLLQMKISDIHPKSELKKSKSVFTKIKKSGHVKFEISFKKRNGEVFPAEVSSSMFEIGGEKVIQGIIRDIEDRKKAEEALKESEELYRSVVETSPEAITITDLTGNITFVSKQTIKIHGVKNENNLIGKNAFDLIAPEDRERALENLQKTLKKGVVRDLQYNLLRKDGSEFIGEMNAALVKDAHGKPKAFIATTRDITQRKRAEEAILYRLEFEEIITTFSTHFINLRTDEIDDAINLALREIGQFADVDRSYVFLVSENGKKMTNTHEWCQEGIKSKKDKFDNIDVNALKWGINRLKKLFPLDIPDVNDLPKDAAADKRVYKAAKIKSLLSVPIVMGGALYGFLGFDSVKSKRIWSIDTIAIMNVVAQIFANALERKRVEETVRESEEKFKSLAEKSPNMIFINQRGKVVYANEKCEEVMGYSRDELTSDDFNFMSLIAPESIEDIKRSFSRHMKGEKVPPYEYTILTKAERRIESIIATKLISYEGDSAILGIITDISTRKEAEEEIKELKEFSESIVDTMNEGIVIMDEDGILTFMNPKVKDLLGYSLNELIGKHWDNILASDYHRRMRDCIRENLGGNQDRFEGVLIKKNQTELPVLISASPQMKNGRFAGVLIVITDITERKKEDIAREELMKYKIKRGSTYLIEEKFLEKAKDVVTELYQNHFDGIIITREHPETIKSEINLPLSVYWMTNDPKDKQSVRPQFSLLEKIIDDNIDRNSFVFLDRFDYIITQNSFKEALNFIQHLNEIFYMRKAILIVSLDPNTLTTQELSLLEKETSVMEKKHIERLSGDLMDLLEFVNKFNRVGESPSYNQVGAEFKVSRTTARKRIRELVERGFILEKKSGRFKHLILTDKGKESL